MSAQPSNTSAPDMVNVEVDGVAMQVPKGAMIIHATDKARISVPRFCYHEKLPIAANCRMCLVDAEMGGRPMPKPQPARTRWRPTSRGRGTSRRTKPMINLEIDGKPVTVENGATVMEAAGKLGTFVPHFCYHKKLSIAANCRMCLVQVEKVPKPVPACATPATEGM